MSSIPYNLTVEFLALSEFEVKDSIPIKKNKDYHKKGGLSQQPLGIKNFSFSHRHVF